MRSQRIGEISPMQEQHSELECSICRTARVGAAERLDCRVIGATI
jgi:hypothetical protein